MKKHIFIILCIALLIHGYDLKADKSIAISGSLPGIREYKVRNTGGDSLVITLTGEKWVTGMGGNNASTDSLIRHTISGFSWSTIMTNLNYTNVKLLNDSSVSIKLPAIPLYDIFQNESYSVTIPYTIVQSHTPFSPTGSFTINYDPVVMFISGTVSGGVTEDQIAVGAETLVIKIRNDQWSELLGGINAITTDFINGIKGNTSPWTVAGLLDYTGVVRTNDSIITITLPAAQDYALGADETVRMDIPVSAFRNTSVPVSIDPAFTVTNLATSVTMEVSYSLPVDEADVRAGGSIILNVFGDNFMGTNEALKTIFQSAFSDGGASSWDTQVLSGISVNKINPKKVTITLPAATAFDITTVHTITPAITPSAFEFHTVTNISTSPSSIVINPSPAGITISGPVLDDNEDSIRAGRGIIILTLYDDEWSPDIGGNNSKTRNLVNSITGTSTGSSSWNNRVLPEILGSDNGAANVALNGNIVTISIPAVVSPDYNITSNDLITVDIPAGSLVNTDTLIDNAGTFTIYAAIPQTILNDPGLDESNLNGSVVTVTLKDDEFDNAVTLGPSYFNVFGPATTSINSVTKINSLTAQVMLNFSGDFDEDFEEFHITVYETCLLGSVNLTTNNITITAIAEPHITNVTIPNNPFKIGSVVPVTIFVSDDKGSVYSYAGGTVAERTLDSLKRISSTEYRGYFTVIEGSKDFPGDSAIRVLNLKLNNGAIQGELFSKNIVQGNDIIDAHKPEITSFLAVGDAHKIGDKVQLVAIGDGSAYTVVNALTSVNGIPYVSPKMSVTSYNNTYNIYYTVEQGDNDVSSPGTLDASLVLSDPAGNESLMKSLSTSNNVTIDAHKPVITSLSIINAIYRIGDVVSFTIVADGTGYDLRNDSHLNNIYASSERLIFAEPSPGTYQITYIVSGSDQEISPGASTARIILTDTTGNSSDPSTTIQPNTAAIYTILPSASISGDAQICEGDSTKLFVNLTGKNPWNVIVSDGSGDSIFNDITRSPLSFYVRPAASKNYTVTSVTDVNGLQGNVSDTAHIKVSQKSIVSITGLASYYFYRTDTIEEVSLTADSAGGVFSGPGVTSSTAKFYPSLAGLAEITPHTIRYDYTNLNGCTSIATKNVYVIKAAGVINFDRDLKGTNNVMCFNDSIYDINAVITTPDPILKTYFFLYKEGVYQGELPQKTPTSTSLDPASLSDGTYEIYFYYYTRTWLNISRKFINQIVKVPEFVGFSDADMCSNDQQISLQGTDPDGVFTGRGVTKNISSKYFFNPSNVGPDSTYIISYTSSTPAGCTNLSTKSVKVNLMPLLGYNLQDSCLSSLEKVNFNNISSNKDRIREWFWEYGDISSGTFNYDTTENGSHIFTSPVARTVRLTGTTYEGCRRTISRSVGFSDTPLARLTIKNKCFSPGNYILINGKESSSINTIDNFDWKITFRADSVVQYSGSNLDSINVQFSKLSIYPVELKVTTDLGCVSDPAYDTLVLRPTIVLSQHASYYEETFDDWGSWSPESLVSGKPTRWLHNLSPAPLNKIPQDSSWFTILNGDSTIVISSVVSPCFNFTGMKRPMLTMDIFRKFSSENLEGASLQYSVDNGKTWSPVGKLDDGVNWYNSYLINNLPNVIGWTGNALNQDTAWIETRHGLDNLAGLSNVQFRIAFVSNNIVSSSRFAFDNVRIREKTRLSLLEHFTNTGTTKPAKDNDVNILFRNKSQDFLKLEYHTGFPSVSDPLNLYNKAVPGARVYYYGINSIPYAVLDGGTDVIRRFDFTQSALSVNEDDIAVTSLNEPKVGININSSITGDDLNIRIKLAARDNLPAGEKILFVVLYEKIANALGKDYINVVKTNLPDAGGTAIYQAWKADAGDTTKLEFTFTGNVSNMNKSVLRVAAFLQDDLTGEIYQTATNDTSDILVGFIPEIFFSNSMEIYPNPAKDYVNIIFKNGMLKNSRLEFYDQLGRKVREEMVSPFEEIKTLYVGEFKKGFYYVKLVSEGNIQAEIKKLIIAF